MFPFKAIKILNSEPRHHPNLHDHHPNCKINLKHPPPPYTTALFQPMDQGNMASFVADYLKQISERLIKAVDNEDEPTIKEL